MVYKTAKTEKIATKRQRMNTNTHTHTHTRVRVCARAFIFYLYPSSFDDQKYWKAPLLPVYFIHNVLVCLRV